MSASPAGRSGSMAGFPGLTMLSLRHLVEWGDHVSVDHPQIDAQHQAIFEIAVEVADIWHKRGPFDRLEEVTAKLGRVLESHFRFEEAQLAEIGYPKLAEHRDEHSAMLGELQFIRSRLDAMKKGTVEPGPGFVVLSFILGVTIGHIAHSDMDYSEFAQKGATKTATGWAAA